MKEPKNNVQVTTGHWERHIKVNPEGPNSPENAFLPKRGKNRPQPHVKVNELDH